MSARKPRSPAQQVEIAEHARQVIELRKGGFTFDQIAQSIREDPRDPDSPLVYADRSGAWRAWDRAIKSTITQPADEERQLQLMQIEQLWSTWYPIALDAKRPFNERAYAERACERLLVRRAKLTGADMPISVRHIVSDAMQIEIEQLAASLGISTDTREPLAITAGSTDIDDDDDETEAES